jgi:type II secretion system protein N
MKVGLPRSQGYGPLSLSKFLFGRPATAGYKHRLMLTLYAMFAAIIFVAFVIASFPYADIISTIVAPLGMKVAFQRQAMNFPMSARLENVSLLSIPDDQVLLQSQAVTVSPGIMWFLLGQPCLKIRAQLYGGVADAAIRQRARNMVLDFDLDSLKLASLSEMAGMKQLLAHNEEQEDVAPPQSGVVLSGDISASGSAQLTSRDISAISATMILRSRDVEAVLVNGLPAVELGSVRGRIALQQGVASLQDLKVDGSEGSLQANGQVYLAPDIARSALRITLSLKPTVKAQGSFGIFLNMLPHPPSEGPYQLQGTLASPSLS